MKRSLLLLLLLLSFSVSNAQNTKAPKIFVSGSFYDMQYLKDQVPVVDFVNDRKDADLHILITSQSTGSGGSMYTLFFYGQNNFDKLNDTLKVATDQTDTDNIIRSKVTKSIKTGLVNYIRRSPLSDQMTIEFAKASQQTPEKKEDPWDSWVFRTSFSGSFSGQESSKSSRFSGSLSANRTTDELRLGFGLSNSYSENKYTYDDGVDSYDYTSITRSQYLSANAIKSISNHWSWGMWDNAYTSTYSNIDFNWSFSTGIEYNFYPYSESTDKMLIFTYKVGATYNKYSQETIFLKESEYLATQSASLSLDLTQPWGSVSMAIYGSNYLQDLNKYNLSFNTYFSMKLFKGFSLYCSAYYSKIHDEIAIPRAGATYEEVLLQIRQLQTQYSYNASVGISFSFGSIFNNIVNPRFGGGGGGTVIYYN